VITTAHTMFPAHTPLSNGQLQPPKFPEHMMPHVPFHQHVTVTG
jgi:hypothetical protein